MKIKEYFFVLLYLITFLFLIYGLVTMNYRFIFISLLCLFFYFLIDFFKNTFALNISFLFEFIMKFFLFCALIFGEILDFYSFIPFWDNILHFFAGFISAIFGFSMINVLFSYFYKVKYFSFICLIFVVCFSMTIGVFWEFFEFGMDKFFNHDMQKDTYINEIKSVSFNEDKSNVVVKVSDIMYTDIYTESGIVRIEGGYLDIGLYDTIEDMFINMLGAFVAGVLCFIYVYFSKFSFLEFLIIKIKK